MGCNEMFCPRGPWANASRALEGTQVVVFYHLAKCGGTSVRRLFENIGAWRMMPYCKGEDRVRRILGQQQERLLFWENHCELALGCESITVCLLDRCTVSCRCP